MWLNQLFGDSPVDFERRCRMRMKVGLAFVVLGALAMGMKGIFQGQLPILYLEPGAREAVPEIYGYLGLGLMAGGIVSIVRNIRYLRSPDLRRKREVAETDERNRLLGLRCWAYTGYAMFLALYGGILVSGFISLTVLRVLLAVTAVYALLLLVFRMILSKLM